MSRTRLSTKGQLIIPKELRERRGWTAGTELEVRETADGLLIERWLEPHPTSQLEDLVGCAGYTGPRRSLEEMDEGIRRAVRARDDAARERRVRD